ncbi:MAG: response regulator [Bilophila wadsworthia]
MHQPEHTPRTLFVDDESINQQIGAEILLALGTEADTADNAFRRSALSAPGITPLCSRMWKCLVMDGATLTHILRSDSRYGELPIIACTAISSPEEEEALPPKGFTAVLRKPSTCRPCKRPSTAMPRLAKPRALPGTQAPRRGGTRHTGRA